jgi:hypothetical protein
MDYSALAIRNQPSIITEDLKSSQWCQLWICGALPQCARRPATGAETLGAIDEHLRVLTLNHELEEIPDYEVESRDNVRRAALSVPELHERNARFSHEAIARTGQCTSIKNVKKATREST